MTRHDSKVPVNVGPFPGTGGGSSRTARGPGGTAHTGPTPRQ